MIQNSQDGDFKIFFVYMLLVTLIVLSSDDHDIYNCLHSIFMFRDCTIYYYSRLLRYIIHTAADTTTLPLITVLSA